MPSAWLAEDERTLVTVVTILNEQADKTRTARKRR